MESKEKIFKDVLEALIAPEHQEMDSADVLKCAVAALNSFAARFTDGKKLFVFISNEGTRTDDDHKYVIWSWEHNAWWAPNGNGYVSSKDAAGEYSFKEARDICLGANRGFFLHNKNLLGMPNEAMIPVTEKSV